MTMHHWAFGIGNFKPFHASSHVCYKHEVDFMIILLPILLCLPYGNAFLLGQELALEWRALSTTECIAFQERLFQPCWIHIVEHPRLVLSAFLRVSLATLTFQHNQLPLEVELLSDLKPCRCFCPSCQMLATVCNQLSNPFKSFSKGLVTEAFDWLILVVFARLKSSQPSVVAKILLLRSQMKAQRRWSNMLTPGGYRPDGYSCLFFCCFSPWREPWAGAIEYWNVHPHASAKRVLTRSYRHRHVCFQHSWT